MQRLQTIRARRCKNKYCPQPQPLPVTAFSGRCRYCLQCKEKFTVVRSAKKKTWAYSILWGMQRDRSVKLSAGITTSTLESLMRLQQEKCGVTGIRFKLPTNSELTDMSYRQWLLSLTDEQRNIVPVLVAADSGEAVEPGNCLFVTTFIYHAYLYFGSIRKLVANNNYIQPIYFQPADIQKEKRRSEL